METLSVLLALCAGNSPVTGEFPTQRPVTRSFDVFFDLRLNKRLNQQSWRRWFETASRPQWRHCNVDTKYTRCRSPGNWIATCDDVAFSIFPFYHVAGVTVALLAYLVTGSTTLTMSAFDFELYLKSIEKYQVSSATVWWIVGVNIYIAGWVMNSHSLFVNHEVQI